jgi:hypothetical protein
MAAYTGTACQLSWAYGVVAYHAFLAFLNCLEEVSGSIPDMSKFCWKDHLAVWMGQLLAD